MVRSKTTQRNHQWRSTIKVREANPKPRLMPSNKGMRTPKKRMIAYHWWSTRFLIWRRQRRPSRSNRLIRDQRMLFKTTRKLKLSSHSQKGRRWTTSSNNNSMLRTILQSNWFRISKPYHRLLLKFHQDRWPCQFSISHRFSSWFKTMVVWVWISVQFSISHKTRDLRCHNLRLLSHQSSSSSSHTISSSETISKTSWFTWNLTLLEPC